MQYIHTYRCSNHISLIYIFIEASKIDYYSCPDEEVLVGTNMISLYNIVKRVESNDSLVFHVEKGKNLFKISMENTVKNANCYTYTMKTLDIDQEQMDIPEHVANMYVQLVSTEFQHFLKRISDVSDTVSVKLTGEKLCLSCESELTKAEVECDATISNSNGSCMDGFVVEGDYSFKYLTLFAKSASITPHMLMYLSPDFPLILDYTVSDYGMTIKLCLAPQQTDDM